MFTLSTCRVMMLRSSLLLCAAAVFALCFTSCTSKDVYSAAVYEHVTFFVFENRSFTRQEALDIMKKNLVVFDAKAKEAKSQGADIIVFPEDGLYGFDFTREHILPFLEIIPIPTQLQKSWNPCQDPNRFANTQVLRELSCIARNSSIVVVANMGDVQYCKKSDPHCPKDGRYQFNTDVVFESDGTLLAKYHKQHLFHENQFNTPLEAEIVTFETSFGVKFGVFTCFDMLFHDPAIALVEKYGIRNIVFPTAWMDGFPILASIEYQQAWSRSTCVNLLAANQHQPLADMVGSGIYSCGEPLSYVYDMKTYQGHLLVAKLPNLDLSHPEQCIEPKCQSAKTSLKSVESSFKQPALPLQTNSKTFYSKLLNDIYTFVKLESSEGNVSVCSDNFCCHASYSVDSQQPFEDELFALGAFSGHHNPEKYFIQVCAVVKCSSMQEYSCGSPVFTATTMFNSFTVMGDFSSQAHVFPAVLSSDVELISPKVSSWSGPQMYVPSFKKPLVSAVLFGRIYELDITEQ